MRDYGVPEGTDGVLPWTWAEERLAGSRNYWISTADASGRPHSMPVWGVWLPALDRFWFSCSPSARKARNLRANPRVVVAPADTVEVVSLEGTAAPASTDEQAEGVEAYWQKYGAEMGMERAAVVEFLTAHAAFAVTPERAFGIIERAEEFSQRATRWRW